MKTLMFSIFIFAFYSLAKADIKTAVKITNGTSESLKNFPVIIKIGSLPLPENAIFDSVSVKSESGADFPCQLDDSNGNKKIDKEDEASALLDLKPGENIFALEFSLKKVQTGSPQKNFAGGYVAIDNGLVQFKADKKMFARRSLLYNKSGEWICIASHFCIDLKLDKQWKGWQWSPPESRLISEGAVRKTVRTEMIRKNLENGKEIKLIQDWHIFTGRKEILTELKIINISSGQVVQITRMVKGFYNVTPGGKASPDTDKYTGLDRSGKLETNLLRNSRYYLKRPGNGKALWCDAYSKNETGLGYALESSNQLECLLLAYIEKNGTSKLRMTEAYTPSNAVLWPEKTFCSAMWHVIHTGDYKAVEKFSKEISNIKISIK